MQEIIKRIIDIFGSLLGFAILIPLFLIISIIIKLNSKGSIFFIQRRPGKDEKIFSLYKFKTMIDLKDERGKLFPDEKRLTKIGMFLRRLSLDEIPELWNVLKGEMSLVGPRPLLMKYLPYFTEKERIRHQMRPGITGLAQINGRNYLKWNDRLAFDIKYVKEWSLFLDLKILIKTIPKIFKREGVVEVPNTIMLDLDKEREKKIGV